MRRAARHLVIATLALACALPRILPAQAYTPKTIVFQSTDASQHLDPAELLRITGLQQGAPLTKAQIEAALQKLGDTGEFSSITYTVNDAALTIRLTATPDGQSLPVRFANFIWWQPDDLMHILEARVPLFHGTLPLQGNQTGQVEDALVALLREKGIPDARVTALPSSAGSGTMTAVALSITSPEIFIGETHFDGTVPAVDAKLNTLNRELVDRDFDLQDYSDTIHSSTQEIFEDAGYLEIASDPPVFSAPRKDLNGYAVDAQVTVHPGPLYRVGSINIHAEPPVSADEVRAALPLKSGDPASASDLRVATAALARLYGDHAFLQAKASAAIDKVPSNHTVNYSFTFSPGAQYRLAAIDTSALPSDLQREFASLWRIAPGALVDKTLQTTLRQTVRQLHTTSGIVLVAKPNLIAHTVTIALQLRKLPGNGPAPDAPDLFTAPSPQPQ